jgi:hypothetical protein
MFLVAYYSQRFAYNLEFTAFLLLLIGRGFLYGPCAVEVSVIHICWKINFNFDVPFAKVHIRLEIH